MSFWDIVWFIFISFAFAAYLMVLFSIVGDIFRDRELSGVAKAAWVIALVLVPLLTSLVYLISRGGRMTERSEHAGMRQRAAEDARIREVAGQSTPSDQIVQAHALLDAGVISQSEYDTLKNKALV